MMCVWLDCLFCFFKQKTAYEMRISDWSSDVCSSDLYVGIVLVSAITVVLFFGGWSGPFLDKWPWLSIVWFSLKCLVFMSGFILLRASLPRPRYDQMMAAGWKVCLPLSLINLLGTAAVVISRSQGA